MAGGSTEAEGYVAFISYSHRDGAIARWLHRRLEGYKLPSRLAGTEGEDGTVPARLTPIFRDREELPAAGDLSEKVRAALALSRNLIVVCSPHSAASPWVAKEIATFRQLHPDRPIFTAIIEGEPDQCFPSGLRDGGIEPLAADLRKEADGRRLGLLKLIAGLAGIGLDALVQRDAARRIRRVTAVTVIAVLGMLAMAMLAWFAIEARREAERQRVEAGGLAEFMHTDLRERLSSVGRLDIMRPVNRRALAYYDRQLQLHDRTTDHLMRARVLQTMGEDELERGNEAAARQLFDETYRTTASLLAESPNDPKRIFSHAQSEYWVGYANYRQRRYEATKRSWQRYKELADRLRIIAPKDARWVKELGYAEGNLCTLALAPPADVRSALRACDASLTLMRRAARDSEDPEIIGAVTNRHGWLADAYRAAGDLGRAWSNRRTQEQLLGRLIARDPDNADLRERWLTNQFMMAELEMDRKQVSPARRRLLRASGVADELIRLDPANQEWRRWHARIEKDLANIGPEAEK